MIGDSETGIATSRITGIATILLRSDQKIASPNADLVGADLAEAVRLILTIELTTKISSLGPWFAGTANLTRGCRAGRVPPSAGVSA